MTELESLEFKLKSIFNDYVIKWENFYDNVNDSEIVKKNNINYHEAISEAMKIEMIKEYVRHNVNDNTRSSIAQGFFDEFDNLKPKY